MKTELENIAITLKAYEHLVDEMGRLLSPASNISSNAQAELVKKITPLIDMINQLELLITSQFNYIEKFDKARILIKSNLYDDGLHETYTKAKESFGMIQAKKNNPINNLNTDVRKQLNANQPTLHSDLYRTSDQQKTQKEENNLLLSRLIIYVSDNIERLPLLTNSKIALSKKLLYLEGIKRIAVDDESLSALKTVMANLEINECYEQYLSAALSRDDKILELDKKLLEYSNYTLSTELKAKIAKVDQDFSKHFDDVITTSANNAGLSYAHRYEAIYSKMEKLKIAGKNNSITQNRINTKITDRYKSIISLLATNILKEIRDIIDTKTDTSIIEKIKTIENYIKPVKTVMSEELKSEYHNIITSLLINIGEELRAKTKDSRPTIDKYIELNNDIKKISPEFLSPSVNSQFEKCRKDLIEIFIIDLQKYNTRNNSLEVLNTLFAWDQAILEEDKSNIYKMLRDQKINDCINQILQSLLKIYGDENKPIDKRLQEVEDLIKKIEYQPIPERIITAHNDLKITFANGFGTAIEDIIESKEPLDKKVARVEAMLRNLIEPEDQILSEQKTEILKKYAVTKSYFSTQFANYLQDLLQDEQTPLLEKMRKVYLLMKSIDQTDETREAYKNFREQLNGKFLEQAKVEAMRLFSAIPIEEWQNYKAISVESSQEKYSELKKQIPYLSEFRKYNDNLTHLVIGMIQDTLENDRNSGIIAFQDWLERAMRAADNKNYQVFTAIAAALDVIAYEFKFNNDLSPPHKAQFKKLKEMIVPDLNLAALRKIMESISDEIVIPDVSGYCGDIVITTGQDISRDKKEEKSLAIAKPLIEMSKKIKSKIPESSLQPDSPLLTQNITIPDESIISAQKTRIRNQKSVPKVSSISPEKSSPLSTITTLTSGITNKKKRSKDQQDESLLQTLTSQFQKLRRSNPDPKSTSTQTVVTGIHTESDINKNRAQQSKQNPLPTPETPIVSPTSVSPTVNSTNTRQTDDTNSTENNSQNVKLLQAIDQQWRTLNGLLAEASVHKEEANFNDIAKRSFVLLSLISQYKEISRTLSEKENEAVENKYLHYSTIESITGSLLVRSPLEEVLKIKFIELISYLEKNENLQPKNYQAISDRYDEIIKVAERFIEQGVPDKKVDPYMDREEFKAWIEKLKEEKQITLQSLMVTAPKAGIKGFTVGIDEIPSLDDDELQKLDAQIESEYLTPKSALQSQPISKPITQPQPTNTALHDTDDLAESLFNINKNEILTILNQIENFTIREVLISRLSQITFANIKQNPNLLPTPKDLKLVVSRFNELAIDTNNSKMSSDQNELDYLHRYSKIDYQEYKKLFPYTAIPINLGFLEESKNELSVEFSARNAIANFIDYYEFINAYLKKDENFLIWYNKQTATEKELINRVLGPLSISDADMAEYLNIHQKAFVENDYSSAIKLLKENPEIALYFIHLTKDNKIDKLKSKWGYYELDRALGIHDPLKNDVPVTPLQTNAISLSPTIETQMQTNQVQENLILEGERFVNWVTTYKKPNQPEFREPTPEERRQLKIYIDPSRLEDEKKRDEQLVPFSTTAGSIYNGLRKAMWMLMNGDNSFHARGELEKSNKTPQENRQFLDNITDDNPQISSLTERSNSDAIVRVLEVKLAARGGRGGQITSYEDKGPNVTLIAGPAVRLDNKNRPEYKKCIIDNPSEEDLKRIRVNPHNYIKVKNKQNQCLKRNEQGKLVEAPESDDKVIYLNKEEYLKLHKQYIAFKLQVFNQEVKEGTHGYFRLPVVGAGAYSWIDADIKGDIGKEIEKIHFQAVKEVLEENKDAYKNIAAIELIAFSVREPNSQLDAYRAEFANLADFEPLQIKVVHGGPGTPGISPTDFTHIPEEEHGTYTFGTDICGDTNSVFGNELDYATNEPEFANNAPGSRWVGSPATNAGVMFDPDNQFIFENGKRVSLTDYYINKEIVNFKNNHNNREPDNNELAAIKSKVRQQLNDLKPEYIRDSEIWFSQLRHELIDCLKRNDKTMFDDRLNSSGLSENGKIQAKQALVEIVKSNKFNGKANVFSDKDQQNALAALGVAPDIEVTASKKKTLTIGSLVTTFMQKINIKSTSDSSPDKESLWSRAKSYFTKPSNAWNDLKSLFANKEPYVIDLPKNLEADTGNAIWNKTTPKTDNDYLLKIIQNAVNIIDVPDRSKTIIATKRQLLNLLQDDVTKLLSHSIGPTYIEEPTRTKIKELINQLNNIINSSEKLHATPEKNISLSTATQELQAAQIAAKQNVQELTQVLSIRQGPRH